MGEMYLQTRAPPQTSNVPSQPAPGRRNGGALKVQWGVVPEMVPTRTPPPEDTMAPSMRGVRSDFLYSE
jgi:hypothetical protein